MRKSRTSDVYYDKNTVGGTGYLVTLYRYTNNNVEEETVVMRFDPKKVNGHGIKQEFHSQIPKFIPSAPLHPCEGCSELFHDIAPIHANGPFLCPHCRADYIQDMQFKYGEKEGL